MHHITTDKPQLYIAHNGDDIVHYGEVDALQNISTGQPYLETFDIEAREQYEARLLELGVSPEEPVDPMGFPV